MFFEDSVGMEARKRRVEHLETYNMSVQSNKFDGVWVSCLPWPPWLSPLHAGTKLHWYTCSEPFTWTADHLNGLPTLLISASFAINPHFLSPDGWESRFSREARVDNVSAWWVIYEECDLFFRKAEEMHEAKDEGRAAWDAFIEGRVYSTPYSQNTGRFPKKKCSVSQIPGMSQRPNHFRQRLGSFSKIQFCNRLQGRTRITVKSFPHQ